MERLEVHRLRCPRSPADTPLVFLEEVGHAFIHGCYAGKSSARWVEQERCREVTLGQRRRLSQARPQGPYS